MDIVVCSLLESWNKLLIKESHIIGGKQWIFFKWLLKNLNYTKFNKKNFIKKTHTQIYKVLQFSFTNFLLLKLLHDNFIIKMLQTTYVSKF